MQDHDLNPWDRRPDEPERPWLAFTLFRDAGAERTLAAVGVALHKGNASHVQKWSKTYDWRARVLAYDRHLDQVTQRAAAKARRDMVTRHAGLANGALGALQAPVAEFIRRMQRPEFHADLAAMPTKELISVIQKSAAAIRDLVGVERTARGVPAEILDPVPVDGESSSDAPPPAPMFRVLLPSEVDTIRAEMSARSAGTLPAE